MAYATVNGADLYYDETGSGEPIIFGHGYAGSHDSWQGVVDRLRGRYRCIRIDFRGAGDSNKAPGPYTIGQFAQDAAGLAAYLGLDRFSYVGLSMGGAIGMQLGVDHGERLDRLVLVAAAPADGIPPMPGPHLADFVSSGDRAALVAMMRGSFARPVDEDFLQQRVDRLLSVSEGHLKDAWQSLMDLRLGDRLAGVQTPTLVVAGAADGLLPSNLADFARLGNATLHVFSRTGHQVPLDVPEALAEAIADFMEHGVVTARTLQERVQAAKARA